MTEQAVRALHYPLRYATALYAVAEKRGAIDAVTKDMLRLKTACYDNDKALMQSLNHPLMNASRRHQAATTIAEGMQLHAVLSQFLHVVAERGRLANLPMLIEAWDIIKKQADNVQDATLITSTEVSQDWQKKIKETVEKEIKKTLNMKKEQDATLLSGFVLTIGSMQLDTSIRTQLRKLKRIISETT